MKCTCFDSMQRWALQQLSVCTTLQIVQELHSLLLYNSWETVIWRKQRPFSRFAHPAQACRSKSRVCCTGTLFVVCLWLPFFLTSKTFHFVVVLMNGARQHHFTSNCTRPTYAFLMIQDLCWIRVLWASYIKIRVGDKTSKLITKLFCSLIFLLIRCSPACLSACLFSLGSY